MVSGPSPGSRRRISSTDPKLRDDGIANFDFAIGKTFPVCQFSYIVRLSALGNALISRQLPKSGLSGPDPIS